MEMSFFEIVLIAFVALLGISAFGVGMFFIFSDVFRLQKKVNDSLDMDLEMVRVSLGNKEAQGQTQEEAWREEVKDMEALFASLASIKPKRTWLGKLPMPTFSFEIANPSNSEEIFFYMATPKRYRDSVEKQVYSLFPDASLEIVPDYTIFTPTGASAVSVLTLSASQALPLKTYEELSTDPLNELSNALSQLDTLEEGAAVQFLIRGAGVGHKKSGKEIAQKMQQGKRLKDVQKNSFFTGFSDLFFKKQGEPAPSQETVQLTPEEQELVKAIEQKSEKKAFSVNIRLLASAESQERADQILSQLENAFSQFERSEVNHLKVKSRIREKRVAFAYIMRLFAKRNAITLGVSELSSMFHFPISTTKTPKIKWLKAGAAPPPINIPKEGLKLGYNMYRNKKSDIRLSEGDRRRHLYVIGQTGVGKSVFLQELAKQDAREGKGMCFIDPHGDAIDDILTSIPKERLEDVVYFDPSDTERPFGLNMLEFYREEDKTFVINEVINIFDKLYDLKSTGGPMFEQYMRNAMLLIMDDEESGSTLLEIPKVLADEDFRKYKLSKTKNMVVKNFWENEAEKAGGEAALANMVPYITSKLTQFVSNDMMRAIISQQKSTINFREAMDEGKILLINLSKGKIGEMNSYLLGMIIVGKLLMAALSRSDISEDERKDFYFYIDEFQNVTTDSISQILSEARKYRLSLTLAHQFIGQLSEEISKAVFGNVGSMATFRVGPEDAEFLEKQFEPVFAANDLVNVDNYNCFVRLLLNNESTKPFNLATYPPTDGNREQVKLIKQLSQLRYGRDKNMVHKEIEARGKKAVLPKPPRRPMPSMGRPGM